MIPLALQTYKANNTVITGADDELAIVPVSWLGDGAVRNGMKCASRLTNKSELDNTSLK